MIPKSCPLDDRGKLTVVLNLSCNFSIMARFTNMCEDCSFYRPFYETLENMINNGVTFDAETMRLYKHLKHIEEGKKK